MGRGGSGVEVRASSIRLAFTAAGQNYRETLTLNGKPLAPTAPNIKHAHRVVATIRARIEAGTFVLGEFFPDSPRVKNDPARQSTTFGKLADAWLLAQGELAPATRAQYRNAIEVWKTLLGEETQLAALTHKVLKTKIGAHPWASPRLFNNYMIPLRGVLALEYHGARALENPLAGITNRRVVKKLPDPLTIAERDSILADLRKHYDVRVWAYFAFAFFTGMRPEEIIALRWEDIDWNAAVARVQRVRTFMGSEREGSKTHTVRDVDLVPPALEALKALKPFTLMKRDEDKREVDLFENPVTGRPWHDERSQREHYWQPALKRLGIRRRRPYCTRHTYCTVALMGGIKPSYIAAQAGHSVKMLLDTYARWIPENDGGAERARLARAMSGISQESPQPAAPESETAGKPLIHNDLPADAVGRRDWTRTKSAGKK